MDLFERYLHAVACEWQATGRRDRPSDDAAVWTPAHRVRVGDAGFRGDRSQPAPSPADRKVESELATGNTGPQRRAVHGVPHHGSGDGDDVPFVACGRTALSVAYL